MWEKTIFPIFSSVYSLLYSSTEKSLFQILLKLKSSDLERKQVYRNRESATKTLYMNAEPDIPIEIIQNQQRQAVNTTNQIIREALIWTNLPLTVFVKQTKPLVEYHLRDVTFGYFRLSRIIMK